MSVNIWDDFRSNFPDIGFDDNLRGYKLIKSVREWAKSWPQETRLLTVSDALATSSLLVLIKYGGAIEMIVIPQNANKPTLISITQTDKARKIFADLSYI